MASSFFSSLGGGVPAAVPVSPRVLGTSGGPATTTATTTHPAAVASTGSLPPAGSVAHSSGPLPSGAPTPPPAASPSSSAAAPSSSSALKPRIIPGLLSGANRGALDWGPQNLIAYGAHSYVVVIDAATLSPFQTLDEHRAHVVSVRWAPPRLKAASLSRQYLQLASADFNGNIIIWNVLEASVVAHFSPSDALAHLKLRGEPSAVVSIEYLPGHRSEMFLLALYAPRQKDNSTISAMAIPGSSLAAGSASSSGGAASAAGNDSLRATATKSRAVGSHADGSLGGPSGSESALALDLFAGGGGSSDWTPTFVLWNLKSRQAVWHLASPGTRMFAFDPFRLNRICFASDRGTISLIDDFQAFATPKKIEGKFQIGSVAAKQTRILAVTFSPALRDLVFFVLDNQVLVFDIAAGHDVGSIPLDRGASPFQQLLFPRAMPFTAYALHENGALSVWERNQRGNYQLKHASDSLRTSKQNRNTPDTVFAMAFSELKPSQLVTIRHDGALWFWDYNVAAESALGPTAGGGGGGGKRRSDAPPALFASGILSSVPSLTTDVAVSPANPATQSSLVAVALNTEAVVLLIDPVQLNIVAQYHLGQQALRGLRWVDHRQLLAFGSTAKGRVFENQVFVVDTSTGDRTFLRKSSEEASFIRDVNVSPSKKYLAVLLNGQPFEIWSLTTLTLIRTVAYSNATAFAWLPQPDNQIVIVDAQSRQAYTSDSLEADAQEYFLYALPDCQLHGALLQGTSVQPYQIAALQQPFGVDRTGSNTTINALDAIVDWIACGDSTGVLAFFSTQPGAKKTVVKPGGVVCRLRFTPVPAATAPLLLVLFVDGSFAVWDVRQGVCVSNSSYLSARGLRAVSLDWLPQPPYGMPVIAANDGSVRVLDRSLNLSSSPNFRALRDYLPTAAAAAAAASGFFEPAVPVPLSPHLLSSKAVMQLKLMLMHAMPPDSPVFHSPPIWAFLNAVQAYYAPSLSLSEHMANRFLLIAHYLGDPTDTRFWLLFLNSIYSRLAAAHRSGQLSAVDQHVGATSSSSLPLGVLDPFSPHLTHTAVGEHDGEQLVDGGTPFFPHVPPPSTLAPPASVFSASTAVLPSLSHTAPVIDDDTFLDILRDPEVVHKEETRSIATAAQNLPKHSRYESTKRIAWNYSVLGDRERSVNLLMQTPPDHPNFYCDILRACVIAASISHDEWQKTVLFGATNLLATDYLHEGVQLLLLIGRGLDACHHLQNRGHWDEAGRIAKTALPVEQANEVMNRWANHLIRESGDTRDQDGSMAKDVKMHAIEILLTLGKYHRIMQLLHRDQHFDLAAHFYQALQDFKCADTMTDPNDPDLAPLPNLLESIHLDYAYFLHTQDTPLCRTLANHYWNLAGEVGQRTKDMVLAESRQIASKPARSASAAGTIQTPKTRTM